MPKPQIAVGAVVVHDDKLLLIQRGNPPGKGLWTVPGGRVEHGEYLSDALIREVREETGLDITPQALIGILEVVGDPHYVILDFAAEVKGDSTPSASGDAVDVKWVPLKEVCDLDCTPRFVETMSSWGVLPSGDQQT